MNKKIITVALAAALAATSMTAVAQSAGDMTLTVGAHWVNPKDGNGTLTNGAKVDVNTDVKPTVAFEYFVADNIGIELLAALPFKHDISLNDVKAAETTHLPPTLTAHYHFPTDGMIKPFIGAGINATAFYSEKIPGAKLDLQTSWGLAAHAGVDFKLDDAGTNAIRVDIRWIDIDTDVILNGANVGTAEIDPLVYGAAWVMKF